MVGGGDGFGCSAAAVDTGEGQNALLRAGGGGGYMAGAVAVCDYQLQVSNVAVTAPGADVGGKASGGAGGSGDDAFVAVSKGLALGYATNLAGLDADAGGIQPVVAGGADGVK